MEQHAPLLRLVLPTTIYDTKVQIKDQEKMHSPKDTPRNEMPKFKIKKEKLDCARPKYIDITRRELNVSTNSGPLY